MLYIQWGKINETGVPIIDEQHRGIVSTINSLHYFMRLGQGRQVLNPVIIMMIQYTKIHFQTEIMLMEASGFPDLARHLTLHGQLMQRLSSVEKGMIFGEDPEILLVLLKDWWLGHINDADLQYAPYVKKHLRIQ